MVKWYEKLNLSALLEEGNIIKLTTNKKDYYFKVYKVIGYASAWGTNCDQDGNNIESMFYDKDFVVGFSDWLFWVMKQDGFNASVIAENCLTEEEKREE